MIQSSLIAIGGIVGLMLAWIAVQFLWKQVFADHIDDEDAMAQRTKCGNCNCTTACENKRQHQPS